MIERTIEFSPDFVFGSATAAHQVEGDNRNNDWWAHEHAPDTNAAEPSGVACDHFHRFTDDFRLLASLGQKAHRLSIEWSRIEPADGQIDRAAIDHYRRVLSTLREEGLEPWLTLHHFTSPLWFARLGGFAAAENLERFRRFVALVARELGDLVGTWCTINEPTIVAEMGYRFGYFPPRHRDAGLAVTVLRNFFHAHALASNAIREHARTSPGIGITLSVHASEPYRADSSADRDLAALRDAETNGVSFEALRTGVFRYPGRPDEEIPGLAGASTFVGIQYYTRTRHDAASGGPGPADPDRHLTQMGWEVYPAGFAPLLRRASDTGLPVVVTENGIATDDDRVRVRYIADHLAAIDDARRNGADVRGYFYWSSMDNFEWNFGYRPTFGLVEVDRKTLERRPRPSARLFGELCRTGRLTPDLVREYS